jgi:CSLREA domain-containing protein
VAIDGPLAPGIWLHAVSVPSTGQQQYQQTLVVTDPSASSPVEWTLFAAVLQVNRDDDGGDGTCDSTCTLRDAVQTANGSTGPVLIQFDHTAGIAHAAVTGNAAVAITAPNTMIDGTDAAGNPSPLGDLAARTYPTVVDLAASNPGGVPSGSCPCTESPGGALRVQAESVRLRGLSLERLLPPQICCGDEDMVAFDTGSKSSRIETCRLDGGAAAIASAEVGQGQTGPPTGKDCVDADTTGATAAEPVVVENSELRFCHDRGVKSRQGFVSLQRNWIHHNLRGGVFAQSPDVGTTPGIVEAVDNLIERNGLNCPTGDPSACGPEHVTRVDASEISLQGAFTQVLSTGNTLRDGVAQGLYFQDQSKGTVTDTYVCGIKDQSDGTGTGIVVQKTRGATSDIVVRGSAAVYNGDAGVKFFANVAADVGKDTGAGVGRNAFTENGTQPGRNVVNLLDTPASVVEAHGNQWQHCYPPGHLDANTCDDTAVGNGDTNDAPGQSNKVDVTNSQPHGQTGKPVITAVTPTKAATGDVVRISGSLFDAISGQTGGAAGDCRDLAGGNTCHPLSGTCVEFQVDGEWVEALDVIAVTPTSITARSPLMCSGPSAVRVRRRKLSTQGQLTPQVISNNAPFCHN